MVVVWDYLHIVNQQRLLLGNVQLDQVLTVQQDSAANFPQQQTKISVVD